MFPALPKAFVGPTDGTSAFASINNTIVQRIFRADNGKSILFSLAKPVIASKSE